MGNSKKKRESTGRSPSLEIQFRSIFNGAADAIFIADMETGIIIDANSAASRMIKKPVKEIVGLHQSQLHPGKSDSFSRKTFQQNREELFTSSIANPIITSVVRSDGKEIPVEVLASKVTYNSRLCLMGTFRDITERNNYGRALIENEANLKAILENSLVSIWSIDTDFIIQYTNEVFASAYEASFGNRLEKGVNVLEGLPDTIRPVWKERYTKVLNNEQQIFTDEIDTGTGKVYIEVAMNPIVVDGKVVGASMYGNDITRSTIAAESLKESEERFRTLSSIASEGLLIQKDGLILEANMAFAKMFGYGSPSDLIGKNGIETLGFTERSRDILIEKMKERSNETYDIEIITRQGRVIPVETSGTDIYYKDQHARLVFMRDISERKFAEQELIKAKEKAEESDRLKSAFLANMSHEIRTPMNGILGFANLLKSPHLTGEEQDEFIGIIEKSGNRMLNLINDLVNISKIESNLVEVFKSSTNIHEQLEYIHQFFKTEAQAKGLILTLVQPSDNECLLTNTDKEKVYAILSNLVKNAIKFTPTGKIEFGCGIENEMIKFFVRDTGIGIPKDKIEMIFERFIQVNLNVSRGHEGTGLGLSISKAYVEILGGEIWVTSEAGKGTEFCFTIPYEPVDPDTENFTDESSIKINRTANIRQGTILIADDDDASRLFLNRLLMRDNYTVLNARNGKEAVECCKAERGIDIILMDIKMPVMDGYSAAEIIRKIIPSAPIIAQTSFAMESEKEQFRNVFDDYITKPIRADELKEIIARNIQNGGKKT